MVEERGWYDVYEFSPEQHREFLKSELGKWGTAIWDVLSDQAKMLVMMELAPDIDNELGLFSLEDAGEQED